ncbi:MAG: DUF1232 domain-containing protein [Proteobacteria bacterium]|nr:DUF1232 domain-containing protein [Pseudomonadota bacterium]
MKKQADAKVTIEMNRGERRLYDRLRAGIVAKRPGRRSGPRDLLLLLPDLTVLLARLLRDDRVPIGGKAIAVLSVGYVLSPLDLLPTFLFGPIGLLDDLFIVTAALSRMLNYVHPDVVRSHWSGQGDALDAIQRASEWSETQLRSLLSRVLPSLLRR